jgi:hypothetical protein
MLPSHRRAITDILGCRTEALGGHLWRCDACSAEVRKMTPDLVELIEPRPHALVSAALGTLRLPKRIR